MFCHVDRIGVDIGVVIYQQWWCILYNLCLICSLCFFSLLVKSAQRGPASSFCNNLQDLSTKITFLITGKIMENCLQIDRYIYIGYVQIHVPYFCRWRPSATFFFLSRWVFRRVGFRYQAPQPRRVPLWGAWVVQRFKNYYVWRFPEMGVPQNGKFYENGWLGGYPHFISCK